MDRKGICVAGNMLVDFLYSVRGLPRPGELTTINDVEQTAGGALCNVIGDLAAIDSSLPLGAVGRVGTDAEGNFVLDTLRAFGNIDLSMIKREGKTSFTAVMADEITKERTFFHYRGANAKLCEADFNWNKISGVLLHIGYILLLDALDAEDAEYGTKMAKLLRAAKKQGIKTSVDVVSETGDRFKRIVPPALKYADYCIINELEVEQITGIKLRDGAGALIHGSIPDALKAIKGFGVSEWAVIHCPEGGYGLDQNGAYAESSAVNLPAELIKGKVGAGDAFCAGAIYTASGGGNLEEGLEMGNAAAAACLTHSSAAGGMMRAEELRKLRAKYE